MSYTVENISFDAHNVGLVVLLVQETFCSLPDVVTSAEYVLYKRLVSLGGGDWWCSQAETRNTVTATF